MSGLKQTPLYPLYGQYGAKTIDFGGWDLPVHFSGIMKEHETVRTAAGLFDVSHMGEFIVEGPAAESFLQKMTVNDVSALVPGQAQYSLMCYTDGGVVDDLLIYKKADDSFMLVVNASNIQKDFDWLERHREDGVTLVNLSDEMALLALQGPKAEAILQRITDVPLQELGPFRFVDQAQAGDGLALISRTGYTGEDGFEIYVRAEEACSLWEQLLEVGREDGLLPVGLGARDTLRFEARLPLYGQELNASITPLEAGLGFFVKLNKGADFIGRAALVKQKEAGLARKLVGIEMIERGIPRTHYAVGHGDEVIGEVTSGTQSPTTRQNVGLALIRSEHAQLGTELWVEIRGKRVAARVVKTPFYSRKK
ncbi:glycine cleavage system aminomethyltransferase GcvT [Paenibacillus turpanensis]|uniref:glycine cleavage system aminomethyltransferase GcvT n=1 Tax=Paenibacillus turpanensis TaxID=2689078 RepID=UPI00140C92C3|nr:glycine cleavage system aminomethyltransferase GcvT [Paenibacillus turpanensis]